MKKSIFKLTVVFALILVLSFVPAMAGNSNYNFNLSLSGRTFIPDRNSGNNKINAWQPWIVRVVYMSYSDPSQLTGTLGTAFAPAYYESYDYVICGGVQWAKTAGRYNQGSWNNGSTGKRYLTARQDDLLSCTSSTYGVWNADSTY